MVLNLCIFRAGAGDINIRVRDHHEPRQTVKLRALAIRSATVWQVLISDHLKRGNQHTADRAIIQATQTAGRRNFVAERNISQLRNTAQNTADTLYCTYQRVTQHSAKPARAAQSVGTHTQNIGLQLRNRH